MWEELKTFIEVVEQQSFTKAAQKLNISQPTVSLHTVSYTHLRAHET